MEKIENEVWVSAKSFTTDYTGLYIVSNLGRCWSIKSQKFIGSWAKNGYFYVNLSKNEKQEGMQVGRLMLLSFNIPIPEHLKDLDKRRLQASHIDEDITNNCLSNFCWESPKENNSRPMHRQRCSKLHKGKHLGKEHHRSKPVLQFTKSGELIREWNSMMDVQRELGINQGNITHCCNGRYNSTGGYIWKYA